MGAMSIPHRCSKAKCRKRVTLPRLVAQYVRVKKCPACGCDSLKPDLAHRAESKRNRCNCDGLPFPHRIGSIWCDHSTITPTDSDYMSQRSLYSC